MEINSHTAFWCQLFIWQKSTDNPLPQTSILCISDDKEHWNAQTGWVTVTLPLPTFTDCCEYNKVWHMHTLVQLLLAWQPLIPTHDALFYFHCQSLDWAEYTDFVSVMKKTLCPLVTSFEKHLCLTNTLPDCHINTWQSSKTNWPFSM